MTFSPQPFLHKGKLDFVLTSEMPPRSNLFYMPMFDFEVRLILSPNPPLVLKKQNYTKRLSI